MFVFDDSTYVQSCTIKWKYGLKQKQGVAQWKRFKVNWISWVDSVWNIQVLEVNTIYNTYFGHVMKVKKYIILYYIIQRGIQEGC